MQQFMGREKHKHRAKSTSCRKCGALCCGSRLSASSSSSSSSYSSSSSGDVKSSEISESLLYLAHEMVQARLKRMITERRAAAGRTQRQTSGCSKLVVLIASNRSSYDPRRDFRDSMLEVITSEGLMEPKELRTLLNCYMSLNSREHRQVILEAFHEVCTSLFPVSSR